MSDHPESLDLVLEPEDNERLRNVCGQLDEHLRQVESRLGIEINNRGNSFRLLGEPGAIEAGAEVLQGLYRATADETLSPARVHLFLQESGVEALLDSAPEVPESVIKTRRGLVRPRGPNQAQYVHKVLTHDINFGVGPAGTGKTYLAVACAVDALERDQIRRILLVRPAVEAGERLGFLPGDLSQKIDPYLRPLYDALYEMLGFERVHKLIERNVIEVAPLAYMRGRTLNEAFIILDEAQNTTVPQMKMFLTRMGAGSKIVVSGDSTQVDLPHNTRSGLSDAIQRLEGVKGVAKVKLTGADIVRHELVQRIVDAYERETNGAKVKRTQQGRL
ncbi:MAG: PhoH family protein [Gammaproteobacteria bacterium]|nr:PhoH family protein [Gammaproteobacteria bacterium]